MKLKVVFLLCMLTSIYPYDTWSQDYHHIGIEDGLSERRPSRILQDSRGLIWLKTYSGLHVYDGYKARFIPEIYNRFNIKCFIQEDNFGNLYFHDSLTVQVVDVYDYSISTLRHSEYINGVSINADGYGILCCEGKNYIFKEGAWQEEQVLPSQTQDLLDKGYAIRTNQKGFYQLRGRSKSDMLDVLLDRDYNIIESFNPSHHPYFKHHDEGKILVDTLGGIWYDFFYGPMMKWVEETETFELKVGTIDDRYWLRAFILEGVDDFVVSSQRKLWGYNPYQDHTYLISDDYPTDQYSPHEVIKDREGNYFLLGEFGVYILRSKNSDFTTFITESKSISTNENSVRSITEIDTGKLLISTKVENYIYDLESETIQSIGRQNVRVRGGVKVAKNEVYLANVKNGLVTYDTESNRYTPIDFNDKRSGSFSGRFNGIHKTGQKLWLPHLYSLQVYDILDQSIYNFEDWRYGTTYFVLPLADSTYLLACEYGLLQLDKKFRILQHWNTKSEQALSSDFVYHISRDVDNTLWISTRNGIDLFNLNFERIGHFGLEDGLPNNRIYACHHERQNVWIPTDNGLALYNLKYKVFKSYNTEHGLPHHEFNSNAFHLDSNFLCLGTLNGMVLVNLKNEYIREDDIPIYITAIQAYSSKTKNLVSKAISKEAEVCLKPDESSLKIRLGMAHYDDALQNVFRYRILGYHDDWKVFSGNVLEVETLAPGNYEVLIRGSASDGSISAYTHRVFLRVEEAFTKSTLFFFLCIAGIGFLFWGIYKYRMQQIMKVANVKEQISKNLHDEVGSIMTRIAFESDLVLSDVYSNEESKDKIKEIAENSRSASTLMSDIVWSLDNRKDKFEDLHQRMKQQLYLMLTPLDVSYKLDTDQLDLSKKLKPEIRQNVYLIFKEAIHNIVKHSDADQVKIVLDNQERFYMSIKDNGSGIIKKKNGLSSGQGMQNMKERAVGIDGVLDVIISDGFEIQLRLNT